MKKGCCLFVLLLAIAGVVGVRYLMTRAQDLTSSKGGSEAASKKKAAPEKDANWWDQVVNKAQSLTSESPDKALSDARDEALQLQTKLAAEAPSEVQKFRLESVQLEIARLSRAMDLQKMKAQADEAVANAQKAGDNAQASVDDIKSKLASTDAAYKNLQDKIAEAQKSYDEDVRQLDALKKKAGLQ